MSSLKSLNNVGISMRALYNPRVPPSVSVSGVLIFYLLLHAVGLEGSGGWVY